MTKTPVLSQFSSRRTVRGKELSEPFLLTSGKVATTGPIERSKLPTRWLVLFLASLLLTCNYYCYDNPSALYAPLARQFEGLDGFDIWFDLLYSVYSIPNVVLPLLGGILVDHAGLYRSLNLFAILLLIGQVLFAVGCSATNMWLMVAGRFVFGLGGEAITVAQTALVERWFCNSGELALAMGISLSISRLGSVLNNVVSPYISIVTLSPAAAIWVGVVLSCITVACCLWLECLDRAATQRIKADATLELAPSPPMTRFVPLTSDEPSAALPLAPVSAFGSPRPPPRAALKGEDEAGGNGHRALKATVATTAMPVPPHHSQEVPMPPVPTPEREEQTLHATSETTSWVAAARSAVDSAWTSSTSFSRPFWLLSFCCVVIYGTVLPFNNIASALLLERDYFPQGSVWPQPDGHEFVYDGQHPHPPGVNCGSPKGAETPFCAALAQSIAKAGWVMSEPYVMSAALTPVLGSLVDKCGYRADLVLLSAVCLLVTHLMLSFTMIPAEILLVGMGLGYSVFASVIWPAIPSVVEQRLLGTAYGMITVLQNMGLTVLPLAIGVVHDVSVAHAPAIDPNPYWAVTLFFALLALSGIICSLVLNSDAAVYHALNRRGGVLPSATPSPTASP